MYEINVKPNMESEPLVVNGIKIQENPSHNPKRAEIAKVEEQMMEYEESNHYNKGLKLAIDSIDRFPENPTITYCWTALFYGLLGKNKKSLQTLAEGLTKGAVWSTTFLKEGFQGLKDHARFLEILELSKKRFKREKEKIRAELLVRTPKSYITSKKYPLLLVFHGRFDSNAANDIRCRNIAKQKDIFLALLQSSQMQSLHHFVWDDENKALEDLGQALTILVKRYPIDSSKIILAGVSQGSEMALVVLFSGFVTARKFISVTPSFGGFSYQFTEEDSFRNKKGRVRGYFIVGEKDPRFNRTKSFFELLRKNGIECKLFSFPELGHQIPDDFDQILVKAVDFVQKEKF